MREIKFRAWSPDNQEMYYSDQDYENGGYRFHVSDNSVGYYPTYFTDELDHFCTNESDYEKLIHVMQYTGLKDKNGKEIYEGDVLFILQVDAGRCFFSNQRVEVEFGGDAQFGFAIDSDWYGFQSTEMDLVEVIGNIYQNSELLKP